MDMILDIQEIDAAELDLVDGGKSVSWYLNVIQTAEWLGEKAYELGYWMGSH